MRLEEKEELREYLSENYPFELRRKTNLFASLAFLDTLDWINSVPASVLQSFLVFFLLKQAENPRSEFENLLDESIPLCERITVFCKGLLPKNLTTKSEEQQSIVVAPPRVPTPEVKVRLLPAVDTPPVVKKKLKFTLPSYVAPPTPSGRIPFMPSLALYTTDPKYINSHQVWFSNAEFCVVYDAYPKARFHFLILPKMSKPAELRALGSKDLDMVQRMYALAMDCVKLICDEHEENVEFRFGFHANPSLTPLHMHCISSDFDSSRMNSVKHWNSFTHQDLWIHVSRVERELAENGAVRVRSKQELSELEATHEPTCSNCKYRAANVNGNPVELLKRHLRTKSCCL